MKEEIIPLIVTRFRGLRKDGQLIQSNNIEDFPLQDFIWFEEVMTITKEMWEDLQLRSNIIYTPSPRTDI